MPIDATCPHCKKQFQFSDEWAGRLLLCRECSHTFTVPEINPMQADTSVLPPPSLRPRVEAFAKPAYDHHRIGAARICVFFAVLSLLAALGLGFFAAVHACMDVPAKEAHAHDLATKIIGGAAAVSLFISIFYFFCGSHIRDGGRFTPWLMLPVSLLSILSHGAGLLYQVTRITNPSANPITLPKDSPIDASTITIFALIIGGIFFIMYLKLFLHLLAVVTEPKPKRQARSAPATLATHAA